MPKYEPTTDLEMDIADILGSAASKTRVDKLVELIELIEQASDQGVDAVGVKGARSAVERVEVYGLRIGVDANGNAATIESDYGLEIVS